MKLAVCAYHPEWQADWAALSAKLERWVSEAAGQGAELLLFPEYGGCEAALVGTPSNTSPADWAARMNEGAADWVAVHWELARRYGVHILAGSLCVRVDGQFVNRAYFISPSGKVEFQDKMILIPYERDEMGLTPGTELKLFDTSLGKIGILVCYDSEFPLQARVLCEAGADLILVPSATDLPAGQTRVRQSCRARAIENQVLVAQSPVLGPVTECDILDYGTGRAGIFCPPDHGLPSDGIIAQGETDQAGWIYAEVDLAAVAAPRQSGQVGNFSHWIEQDARLDHVKLIAIR